MHNSVAVGMKTVQASVKVSCFCVFISVKLKVACALCEVKLLIKGSRTRCNVNHLKMNINTTLELVVELHFFKHECSSEEALDYKCRCLHSTIERKEFYCR